MNLKQLAIEVLGSIEWVSEDSGFIECPGKNLHTGKNSKRDCKVIISGAPTIHCFHSSCSSVIETENLRLRKALAGEEFEKRKIDPMESQKLLERNKQKRLDDMVKEFSKFNKATIIENNPWSAADAWEQSPTRLSDTMEDDYKLLLNLFSKDDVVWIGDVKDSSATNRVFTANFQPVSHWLENKPIGNFTCPSTFKPGTHSRSNENVVYRKFLVIESDELSQDQICSVFKWCQKFITLRAIVYTGGKSLHGWFDFPSEQTLKVLKLILPQLDCDEALFKPAQPVRLPGMTREDKIQSLLYYNP